MQNGYMKRRSQRWARWTVAIALAWSVAVVPLPAKVKYYSLVEKTRSADAIFIGQVTALRANSVAVRVQTLVKGSLPAEIELGWERTGSTELPPAVHAVGAQILAFTSGTASPSAPFAGPQGTLTLQPGWANQYQIAIGQILEFDAASLPDLKSAVLERMMTGTNQLSQASALEIIYLEYHTNAFTVAPLVAGALRLAQQPEPGIAIPALQVLSRIGEKEQIPALIQLMGGRDASIALVAFRVTKGLTGADLPVETAQSREIRAAAAKRWAEWWDANKDSVVLVK